MAIKTNGDAVSHLHLGKRWILLSHVKPDGDTIGSAAALFSIGRNMGKECAWGGRDAFPDVYSFIPHSDAYRRIDSLGEFSPSSTDVVVSLDTSTADRSVDDLLNAPFLLNIDHHYDNPCFGDVYHVDPSASSTAEVLWFLLSSESGFDITRDAALALYAGIATDSGSFSFSCTTPRTHVAVSRILEKGIIPSDVHRALSANRTLSGLRLWGIALSRIFVRESTAVTWLVGSDFRESGADRSETENLVNQLLLLRGIGLAILLIEEDSGVRASIRSEGSVSAADIAHRFGGGGHPQAAGCTLPGTLESAERLLFSVIGDNGRLSASR